MFSRAVIWLCASLLLSQQLRAAEDVCYAWTRGGITNSSASAIAELQKPANVSAGMYSGGQSYTVGTCTPGGAPTGLGQTATCQIMVTPSPPTSGGCESYPSYCVGASVHATLSFTSITVECPDVPDEPCEALSGLSGSGGATPGPTGGFCLTDDGDGGPGNQCAVVRNGASMETGTGWFGKVLFTGAACGETDDEISKDAPNCESSSAGTICIDKTENPEKKSCGTFNGEFVCLDEVPDGSCLLMANGGAVCTEGSDDAPKDSEGDPLPPDKTLQHDTPGGGDTNNYNYYSSSSVTNSTTPVVGSSGSGSGSGDGDGEGEGEGVEECESDADCFGTFPTVYECVDDMSECIGDATAAAWTNLREGVPLLGMAEDLHTSLSTTTTCPAAPVEMFGETYDFMAGGCELIDPHRSLLALIMQVFWSLVGLRIVMTGND